MLAEAIVLFSKLEYFKHLNLKLLEVNICSAEPHHILFEKRVNPDQLASEEAS